MPDVGAPELMLVLLITLLVFGGSKVAEIGGSLGKGIKEFKSAMREDEASATQSQAPAVTAPVIATPVLSTALPACAKCGSSNSVAARFCNECGSTLTATSTRPEVAAT